MVGYGGGAHRVNPPGFWGDHDSLHTFCEPSYALTFYVAEPINALGSFIYVAFGAINLHRLYGIGKPLHWRATVGWWSLVVVGVGSILFHATMRYHMELLDEIPMLFLVTCGCLQMSDLHPLGKRYRCGSVSMLDVVLGGGMAVLTIVYLITRIFGLFVTGFTVGTVFLLGLYLTDDPDVSYGHLGGRAAILIILARVAWELENHLCATHPYLWPLHNVWHLGSCLAANDLFLYGYLGRIDKRGSAGIIDGSQAARGTSPMTTRSSIKPKLPRLNNAPEEAHRLLDQSV